MHCFPFFIPRQYSDWTIGRSAWRANHANLTFGEGIGFQKLKAIDAGRLINYHHWLLLRTVRPASAESSDLFGHDQMRLTLTTIVGIDPCFQFICTQQGVRFRYSTLPMEPFWFYGVARPGCDARRVVPDQQQGGEASGRELGGTPQKSIVTALTGRPATNRSHLSSAGGAPDRSSRP